MGAPLIRLPEDVTGYSLGYAHNNFAIVVPEETTNWIVNPSFENAANWSYGWGTDGSINWQASLTYASRGRVSAYQAGTNGSIFTDPELTLKLNHRYTFSCDVRGRAGGTVTLTAEASGQTTRTRTFPYTGRWQRIEMSFTATTAAADAYTLRIATNAPVHVDGVQFEEKDYATTYCDGDVMGFGVVQNEYRWDTVAHASISYRSALTRHGGRLTPLGIGENVHVVSLQGLGASPMQTTFTTLYDGSAYVTLAQDRSREVTMIFALYATSPRELRAIRRQLIDLFAVSPSQLPQPFRMVIYPNDAGDNPDGQPLILTAYYLDGLEGMRTSHYSERVAIRMQSTTAYLSEFYGTVQPFGALVAPYTVGQVMYRNAQGAWAVVTPNATSFEQYAGVPSKVPTGAIFDTAFLGETVVFGGNFVNLEGNTALDYLVAYNPLNSAKTIVGDGVNAPVFGLAKGRGIHKGKLFISGEFTGNAAATRTARRYAVHPGGLISTNLTFPAVGLGNGSINDFAFHSNGRVYVCGDFSQLSNGVNVPGVAYADATTLSLGPLGLQGTLIGGFWNAAVAGADDLIYFGGMDGASYNGDPLGPVISYEPATGLVRPLGARLNGTNVFGLTFGADGYLYAVGRTFSKNAEVAQTTNYIARYNGFDWEVLPPISGGTPGGSGFYELEGAMGVARADTTLYVVGGFRRPNYGYSRFIGNRMIIGDITIPNYGVGSVATSDGGAVAFSLFAGNPIDGSHPWVKPSDMSAHPPLTMNAEVDEECEWDLHVVGPCVLDSFTNYSSGANMVFAPLTVQAGEYVLISLIGNRIEARSSRGVRITSNFLYTTDMPVRFVLAPGDNYLQLAMHHYDTNATKVSLGIRRRIRSFDYAE